MRASIRDVAKKAGVSPMTVSNVLRRRAGRVSEETQLRVMAALKEMNYIPVRAAVQNRHVETHVIGVVFLQNLQEFIGHRTFQGMTERAKERDQDLLVMLRSQPSWMAPDMEAHFLDRRCDGYIVIGSFRPDLSSLMVAHHVPVVECYSAVPPAGVGRVVGDDRGAMRQAVDLLRGRGHTRIAHLGGPQGDGEADLRCQGFQQAMQEWGGLDAVNWVVRSPSWGYADRQAGFSQEAHESVARALALKPTAVVCANDLLALDLWQLAERQGLRVPEDLSVIGMDDNPLAQERGLTTLAVPFEQVGRAAVDTLMTLTQGGDADQARTAIPAQLIVRRSVA